MVQELIYIILATVTILASGGCASNPKEPSNGYIKNVFNQKSYTNSIGIEFVLIPSGSFIMGTSNPSQTCVEPDDKAVAMGEALPCPKVSPKFEEDEEPAHQVTITKSFYLGKYEVTQEQWYDIMGSNPSKYKGRTNPVESVSWNDVQKFIEYLNDEEPDIIINGKRYRYSLPTEAQWEYAVRAGTTTSYFFGEDLGKLNDYAWYKGNSEKRTHPVGQKKPIVWHISDAQCEILGTICQNEDLSLYDMYGNVQEFTLDWYDKHYYAKSPQNDPEGPSGGKYRVTRGGSWGTDTMLVRSACRNNRTPNERVDFAGFRLALIEE
ncbi:MAG: formylglycine-generating enzyme family protein [Campylobacteraceae bacterium]|jgi:formylglycine-generating enzyme required for sulfatase activity|nr:formylglycine-generating enzyme family protein [Campylobacteraceae bacterium]